MTYNLAREWWVPVIDVSSGARTKTSLYDLFNRAESLVLDLDGQAKAAIYRLLTALTYEALGNTDHVDLAQVAKWVQSPDIVKRFDILDPEQPFWQDPTLPLDNPANVMLIDGTSVGNSPLMYDSRTLNQERTLSFEDAALALVQYVQFTFSGAMGGVPKGAPKEMNIVRIGSMGPASGRALVYPTGLTIQDVIVPVVEGSSPDVLFPGSDEPAKGFNWNWTTHPHGWMKVKDSETNKESLALARLATGSADALSWQNRRIRFAVDHEREVVTGIVQASGEKKVLNPTSPQSWLIDGVYRFEAKDGAYTRLPSDHRGLIQMSTQISIAISGEKKDSLGSWLTQTTEPQIVNVLGTLATDFKNRKGSTYVDMSVPVKVLSDSEKVILAAAEKVVYDAWGIIRAEESRWILRHQGDIHDGNSGTVTTIGNQVFESFVRSIKSLWFLLFEDINGNAQVFLNQVLDSIESVTKALQQSYDLDEGSLEEKLMKLESKFMSKVGR